MTGGEIKPREPRSDERLSSNERSDQPRENQKKSVPRQVPKVVSLPPKKRRGHQIGESES